MNMTASGQLTLSKDSTLSMNSLPLIPQKLLTPGPLTTSKRVRQAAGVDWGSWDSDFRQLTKRVLNGLLTIAAATGVACVPMQGSGTFAVEAAVRTFVPRSGGLVVGVNGAYGERMAKLAKLSGFRVKVVESAWNEPIDPNRLAALLGVEYTHVGIIHCETSTGLLNPLPELAETIHAAGGRLIVDAMSTFGALDVLADHPGVEAVIAASGKCLEGLPGMGFVLARTQSLEAAIGRCDSLSLDLADQHAYLERTGQWRFTPPTHVVAALAQALADYHAEGGRTARLTKYQENSKALALAAAELGLASYLPAELQAPIIHTFYAPGSERWDFSRFYNLVKAQGFILYPGKLTKEETFRVGCIGQVTPETMRAAIAAIGQAFTELGIDPKLRM